jgi:CelD/BcsL family acetyltransferase involved in cellulose biosynthesis
MVEERRHRRAASAPLITSEAFELLEGEWAELHASVPGATPFAHPAWQATWLRHFGVGTNPVFLSVRREERLVGVVPLDVDRDHARPLGDHNVCDYAGVLASPGEEDAVAAGVIEWLMEDLTPELRLWGVLEGSALGEGFAKGAAGFGWSFDEAPEAVSPAVALPDSFEGYLAALGKHDRHELRRKLRHLAGAGVATFEAATGSDAVAAGMDRFLAMMRASRDDKDEFLTPAMEGFFRDLAATFAGLGLARLSTLSLDGVAAAMLLSFENAETTYLYNSGYAPEFASLAVGLLSKAYAIEDAIARGKRTFDFLRGAEEYKHHLGGVPQGISTLTMRSR